MTIERQILFENDLVSAPFAEVFAYWLRRRGSAIAPTLAQFKLHELPADILPWSIIADVGPAGRDFKYRFWGTERVYLIDAEMTGKWVSEIENAHMREANLNEYKEALAIRKPILCNTPVVTGSGREAVFQSLRMPLSDDGKTVSHIYSAMNYTQMSATHYEFYGTDPRRTGC